MIRGIVFDGRGLRQRAVIAGSTVAFVAAACATVFLLSLLLPGARGYAAGPQDDPGAFVARIVRRIVADEYGSAWAELYHPHQRVAPRAEYVACELQTPVGWKVRSVRVLRVVDRLVRIPGEAGQTTAKKVTLRIRIANPSLRAEGEFTHTFTAVPVDTHWNWILTPSRYQLYRSDACGGGTS
jgi:hypothetical protein